MLLFIVLAFIGFVISLGVHVSTFLGVSPQDALPGVWLLHIGLFVVFIPAVVAQNTMRKTPTPAGDRSKSAPDDKGWEGMRHAPRWLSALAAVAFVYGVVNFVVFLVRQEGSARREPNGTYSLKNKGTFIRTLTRDEYLYHRALEVRGFSGHWLMFYVMAAGLLISARRARRPRPDQPSPLVGSYAATTGGAALGAVPILPYGHRIRHLPSIWLHGTFIWMGRMFLWVGLPAIVIFCVDRLIPKDLEGRTALMIFLFLGSAVFGVTVPAALLKRYLPVRCPTCGGSAYCESIHPPRYVCGACGETHEHD